MAIYRYPPEVHEFVKEWATKLRDRDLAVRCNEALGTSFTRGTMKAFRYNHGYLNHMSTHYSKEDYWKYQTQWPQGMYEFIRDNSWGVPSAEMAEQVNEKFGTHFSQHSMKCFRQRHGIRSGLTGWFQRGRSPGNKGKKIEEYMSPEAVEKVQKTQFRKGHRPLNEMPVGATVINSEGYVLRKKSMTGTLYERWELLHRAVWREHYGDPPAGMCIIFKDNNKLNCDINNLMLVSRAELILLTKKGYRFEDPELTEAALNVVRVIHASKKRRKNKSEDIK